MGEERGELGAAGPPGLPGICEYFREYFAHWGIVLPEADVMGRRPGEILHHGWRIQYLFGQDDEGEYLDFYAEHRMTNDRHERVHESGKTEGLPAYCDMTFFPVDATESKKREIMKETSRRDREVAALLESKGFTKVMIPRAWEWPR
jgi:hypothetical protein